MGSVKASAVGFSVSASSKSRHVHLIPCSLDVPGGVEGRRAEAPRRELDEAARKIAERLSLARRDAPAWARIIVNEGMACRVVFGCA
jgi:hypothetical protein